MRGRVRAGSTVAHNEWIEMRLRARRGHRVHLARLGLDVELISGWEIRTEISAKFRRERAESELSAVGFEPGSWWTDAAGDYAVTLARWAGPTSRLARQVS